jgi:NAD-dependent dihydropyrimidine dehydrogenase PreA subunit
LQVPKRLLALVLAATAALWLFGERGRLVLPSSLRMVRAGGRRRFLPGLHGYVYGRWTNQYINVLIHHVTPRLGEGGKKWLSDRYHGKVLTHDQAESIVNLDHDIPLTDLEQIVPYPMARSILLNASPDVAAYECSCRHARANPCRPTQVCMVVGTEPVDFILEHNPQSSRRLSREEALQILKEEHERGHLHSAWFKDAILDRFYVICNCCKCCCGGIEAMVKHGMPMLASSGFVANIDAAACNGCGICVEPCPFDAMSLEGELVSVKWESCMGCGVCTGQCPFDAVSLVRDDRKGIPLDVTSLAPAIERDW